jgi:hypothetical protein
VDTGEIPPFRPNLPEHMVANAPAPSQSSDEKALDDEVRSGKTTRTYPTVILGSTVEYWYSKGNRHAVVSGSPQATQQLAGTRWRKVWATRARYDGEANSVLLESAEKKPDVRMKNSQGDDLLARSFTFSTEEGNDDWSAQDLQGTVTADNQEETGTGTTTTPPPPKAGAAKKPVEKTSPEVKKPTTEVKKPTPGDKTTEQKPTDAPPAKP